ncbi:mechanosensitive ion channel [Photobacterium makurazakiensis]|uniref:mechanosensitive ion channel family protein n=1 Tax=Photobacterium makurazakiensis TaxID=2910234 RepID=UPI003D0F6767
MRLLMIIFTLFTSICLAETEQSTETNTEANTETEQVVAKPAFTDKLQNLEDEIAVLYKESLTKTGTAKNIVEMQMLKKNDEIRAELQNLINKRTDDTAPQIIKFVDDQVEYLSRASQFLSEQISSKQKELDEAEEEQKLIIQKNIQDATRFYHRLLGDQWINYQWLKLLDVPHPEESEALIDDIEQRLDFMSAMLTFDNQQESALQNQLKNATEAEKPSLQLQHILAQRKVASDIEGLQFLVDLGNKMKLDTTSYTKQLFETTGNLTNELLDIKVIWSIFTSWFGDIKSWLIDNTPQLMFKLFVFLVIISIFRVLKKITRRMVTRAVSSPTLHLSQLMKDFFISMSGNIVFIIGLLIALSQVGLDLTPILTGFGVAGVIIGFALQDTLSNFASGMMLLIYRPFDVDDFVEAGGTSGKVSHMSLVSTTIKTFDNQILIVPNSKIWGDTIKNITHERVRRVDMVFGIGYSDDIERTEQVLLEVITAHSMVLRSPEPTIKLHTLNTSSVDFIVRPWVKTEDYWDVYWDITREVKMRFDREGISIPFPQQDVHLHMVDKKATD